MIGVFVQGCDASVLLDKSEKNRHPQKDFGANIDLCGLDVIEMIKTVLKEHCPNIVSCDDIIAYAACDAARYLCRGSIDFAVLAGCLDGVVSRKRDADVFLLDSAFNLTQLVHNFCRKNFTVEEIVILSGAHSIGITHCSSFADRLSTPDSEIDPAYCSLLLAKCHDGGATNPAVVNNVRDEDAAAVAQSMPGFLMRLRAGRDYLYNSYYHNNLAQIVTFNSDWALLMGKEARGHVKEYVENKTMWNQDFTDTLVKLRELPMPAAGSKGEIRKKCNAVNY